MCKDQSNVSLLAKGVPEAASGKIRGGVVPLQGAPISVGMPWPYSGIALPSSLACMLLSVSFFEP
jgi:hypothetical protein